MNKSAFINIQNHLTAEKFGCELIGFAHAAVEDDPRFRIISQTEFIKEKMSDIGREDLFKHPPPFSEIEINAKAKEWEEKRPIIGNRIFWENKENEDPRMVPTIVGTIAARKVLELNNFHASNLHLIIGASNTCRIYGSIADHVKAGLANCSSSIAGRSRAHAFYVSEACTAGSVVINTIWNFIRSGSYQNGLGICAENAPILTHYDDHRGSNLFSVGASAGLIQRSSRESFIYFHNESLPYDGNVNLVYENRDGNFDQDGKRVHQWVTTEVLDILMESLELAGIKGHHIDHFISHQPSGKTVNFIEEELRKRLPTLKKESFHRDEIGNTSCASTGILISKLIGKKIIKKGQLVVVNTFGAGGSVGSYAFIY